ncbi:MAG: hypothetical protein KR126chlam1_00257 [Chlamydiae bacterium]|nr:hypothetical protein [Chlamydiota bacterium]
MTQVLPISHSDRFQELSAASKSSKFGQILFKGVSYTAFGAVCGCLSGSLRPIAMSTAIVFGAIQGFSAYLVEPANKRFFKLLELNPTIMKKVVPILATNGLAVGVTKLIGLSIPFSSALLFYGIAMAVFYVAKGIFFMVNHMKNSLQGRFRPEERPAYSPEESLALIDEEGLQVYYSPRDL